MTEALRLSPAAARYRAGFDLRAALRRAAKAILRHGIAPALYGAGLTAALRSLRRCVRRDQRLLILVYHRVHEPHRGKLSFLSETLAVSPARFDAQMGFLSRHYRVMPLAEALRSLDEASASAKDAVVITFDDGYRDNLTDALPALSRYELPATIFVATDHIGTGTLTWFDRLVPLLETLDLAALRQRAAALLSPEIDGLIERYLAGSVAERKVAVNLLSEVLKRLPEERKRELLAAFVTSARVPVARDGEGGEGQAQLMLDWAEMRAMTEARIDFGSHTCSHPIMTRIPPGDLAREIADSKRAIEAELGIPCVFFAYPNGRAEDCPERIGEMLAAQGYAAACANVHGFNDAATDRMMLRRLPIGDYGVGLFALLLEFWLIFGRRAR